MQYFVIIYSPTEAKNLFRRNTAVKSMKIKQKQTSNRFFFLHKNHINYTRNLLVVVEYCWLHLLYFS